jgi:flagellar assembly protein FliH
MISLSKIIKSYQVLDESNDKYFIRLNSVQFASTESSNNEGNLHQQRERLIEEKEQQVEEQRQEFLQYVSDTKAQLEHERKQWLMEEEVLIRQAKEIGYLAGIEEGRQHGYTEYQSLLAQATNIVELSQKEHKNLLESSDKAILKIGIKVAERIVDRILTEREDEFLSLVKKVLKEVQEHQDIHIRVHPEKYLLLISSKEELCALLNRDADMYVYPDEELDTNDCIIDSSFGRIDASVDTQLDEIKARLLEVMEEKEDEG